MLTAAWSAIRRHPITGAVLRYSRPFVMDSPMPRSVTPVISPAIIRRCRQMVVEAADAYQVPPAYIIAHVPGPDAHKARLEVWRRMFEELGLRRHQIARLFGRDLRRVRASVICNAPRRTWGVEGGQFIWPFANACRTSKPRRMLPEGRCRMESPSARMEQMMIRFRISALRMRCREFSR
jgi:hypothetical protein